MYKNFAKKFREAKTEEEKFEVAVSFLRCWFKNIFDMPAEKDQGEKGAVNAADLANNEFENIIMIYRELFIKLGRCPSLKTLKPIIPNNLVLKRLDEWCDIEINELNQAQNNLILKTLAEWYGIEINELNQAQIYIDDSMEKLDKFEQMTGEEWFETMVSKFKPWFDGLYNDLERSGNDLAVAWASDQFLHMIKSYKELCIERGGCPSLTNLRQKIPENLLLKIFLKWLEKQSDFNIN